MPNVRIMNWNIQQFGPKKRGTPGMLTALARVIAGNQIDAVVITELSAGTGAATMTALSAAANAAAGGVLYNAWAMSYPTGGERYGLLIRDIDVVRPAEVIAGPAGNTGHPLTGLDQNQFQSWPDSFANLPVAGALPGTALLPLVQVHAQEPPRGRKRARFAGGTLHNGGYSLGRGFRLPCLIMLSVDSLAGPYLLPLLVCHLGAVRGGRNHLARGQIMQYKDTDIAQRFTAGEYVDLDGVAQPIQELIVTGDFNVDFLQNAPLGNALQSGNAVALGRLSPTLPGGTSLGPAAQPGVPGGAPVVPFVMPPGGWPDGPTSDTIPALALRTAITTRGTMLRTPVAPGAAAVPPYAGACFDNLFYGGVQLAGAGITQPAPGVANETGVIVDVPGDVVRGGGAANQPNVGTLWTHFNGLPLTAHGVMPLKRQWAAWAPSLNPVSMAPILGQHRLNGARFLSDHLPTYIQANLP